MGSSNVACGVSRMTIGCGDPIVLIPLKQTEHSDSCSVGSCYISNDGPCGRFFPLTLPIFGEYNSYGGVENIIKDINTEAIEKFYGQSIEVFVEHMCSCRSNESEVLPKNAASMFVRREVYDYLANNPMSEFGSTETAYTQCDINDYMLKYLGFIEMEKHSDTTKRYSRSFKHPKIPKIVIWSDGTWIRIGDDKGYPDEDKVYQEFYHPNDLEKFLKKKKLFVPPQLEKLKTLRVGDISYDQAVSSFIESQDLKGKFNIKGEFAEEAKKLIALLSEMRNEMSGTNHFLKLGTWFEKGTDVRKLYKDCFNSPNFKKQWVDYKQFEQMLYHVNAPLMPSWNGLQCGNLKATINLAKLTIKLCKEK